MKGKKFVRTATIALVTYTLLLWLSSFWAVEMFLPMMVAMESKFPGLMGYWVSKGLRALMSLWLALFFLTIWAWVVEVKNIGLKITAIFLLVLYLLYGLGFYGSELQVQRQLFICPPTEVGTVEADVLAMEPDLLEAKVLFEPCVRNRTTFDRREVFAAFYSGLFWFPGLIVVRGLFLP